MRRAAANVATEIWRRGALMVMACLPYFPDGDDGEADQIEDVPLGKSEPPDIVLTEPLPAAPLSSAASTA